MACCGEKKPGPIEKRELSKTVGEALGITPTPIPNLSGELTIFNGVGPDQTIPLNEREVWMLRTCLKETLKRAVNEPGYVNGEAKALLINLIDKIVPKDAPKLDPECERGTCECMT